MISRMTRLGSTIRQIRTKRGLTQADAARRACISPSYWALIEQGKREPNLTVVDAVGAVLGVPTSILVFLASDMAELEVLDRSIAERLALLSWKLIEARDADDLASV
jgi:transcriptional regulator with XRE-family HTH domain